MKKLLLKLVVVATAILVSEAAMSAQGNEILLKRDAPVTLSRLSRAKTAKAKKAPSRAAGADQAVIRTAILSKDSWITNAKQDFGMYEYPLSGYNSTCIGLNADLDANGGGAYIGDGKYFSSNYLIYYGMTLVNHYITDANTGTTISRISGNAANLARDLAYDHISGKLYGCFRGDEGTTDYYVFGTLDPENSSEPRTVISKLDEKGWAAMDFDRYGNLYAIDREGALLQVDKGSGATTKVGDTGLTSKYQTSGAIDQATNKFYYVSCGDEVSTLYAVELATAKAEKVYDMEDGEQVGGMYIPATTSSGVTLTAATGLAASIDDTKLSGIITFETPATYSDGSAATGEVLYKVVSNGKTLGEGSSTCGSRVIVPVSLDKSGPVCVYRYCI